MELKDRKMLALEQENRFLEVTIVITRLTALKYKQFSIAPVK